MNIIIYLNWIVWCCLLLLGIAFIITSIMEKRWRPVWISVFLFIPIISLYTFLLVFDFPGKNWILTFLLVFLFILLLLFTIPFHSNQSVSITGKQNRLDERDALFHRFYTLKPGSPEFKEYYKQHSELLEFDNKIRNMPNLGEPGTRSYHPFTSLFQTALFEVEKNLTNHIDWEPNPEKESASPEEFTTRLKGFARYLGADLVGTTKLNPSHIYSHIARDPNQWGQPVNLDHQYAIVVGVEMDYEMIRFAPEAATTTETAFKYFEAARIAIILSKYIQLLGYKARAHVDGNYRVMCVPIAVDAGLGELGRMGLLVTPEFGPRVRLSVVTTHMPLLQDLQKPFGVQHFCEVCKKCASNCPSNSVDSGEKKEHNGVHKWQSQMDTCYRFWCIQGTDCAVCINVCPYSHPGTLLHNLIRWLITRNNIARYFALKADDLLYGRRPNYKFQLPNWHKQN